MSVHEWFKAIVEVVGKELCQVDSCIPWVPEIFFVWEHLRWKPLAVFSGSTQGFQGRWIAIQGPSEWCYVRVHPS